MTVRKIHYLLRRVTLQEVATISEHLKAGLHWHESRRLIGYQGNPDSFLRSLWLSGWCITRYIDKSSEVADIIPGYRYSLEQIQQIDEWLRTDIEESELPYLCRLKWGKRCAGTVQGFLVQLTNSGFRIKYGIMKVPKEESLLK